jgi:uncharacterized protein
MGFQVDPAAPTFQSLHTGPLHAVMLKLFSPQLRVERVWELSPERLAELGLKSLLLDVDCTLTRYHCTTVGPEVAAWLAELRTAEIGLCLVSNGLRPRIEQVAKELGLPFVARALKPLPLGCWRAMRSLGFSRQQTAMVGDQLFADVMAGRLAGLLTILVRPIHPEEEPWFTRLKRPLERWLLR